MYTESEALNSLKAGKVQVWAVEDQSQEISLLSGVSGKPFRKDGTT